jgi:hypothetical protein
LVVDAKVALDTIGQNARIFECGAFTNLLVNSQVIALSQADLVA